MNFTDLYKKIKSIDENIATNPDGTPYVVDIDPDQHDAETARLNRAYKPVGDENDWNDDNDNDGSVRSLMNILDRLENGDNSDVHQHRVDNLYGDMEEEFDPEGKFQANTTPDPTTFDLSDILPTGNDLLSKGRGALKHNGGENPMHEALVGRLSQLYQTIKEETQQQDLGEAYVACIVQHNRSGQAMVQRTKPISRDRAEEVIKHALAKSTFVHPPFMTIYPASAGKLDGSTIMAKYPDMSKEGMKEGKKHMSRAAKGYEKYGKKGMMALADAGRNGEDLEPIQDKFNKYK